MTPLPKSWRVSFPAPSDASTHIPVGASLTGGAGGSLPTAPGTAKLEWLTHAGYAAALAYVGMVVAAVA